MPTRFYILKPNISVARISKFDFWFQSVYKTWTSQWKWIRTQLIQFKFEPEPEEDSDDSGSKGIKNVDAVFLVVECSELYTIFSCRWLQQNCRENV